ncbi:uncharacterized protein Z518_04445 [Rhinocladiella mackenziei CBS 650.93]|uniref:Uncharacterized protein n=1 Tax=Rhinocladiella mackenziei CBS 650.93 TaxID=1442369 RepID=A0A0D2IL95_9EURO|nr:uncharacterized protein Z518_04445 [Rhinocladiella mackenziei CBS 650.93]KIX06469.1 hypothetical protein Z518_04445 [Rhinocladiella mackenziei CBS 650.93]
MATTTSPTRRVLGDKDPNAPPHMRSPRKTWPGPDVTSPVTHASSVKRPLSPTVSPLTSPRRGQKRKIDRVVHEETDDSQPTTATHPWSQMTDLLSDGQLEHVSTPRTSMTQTKSTPNTVYTPFRASQEEPFQVEAEFQIHDEPSQQTLDKMGRILTDMQHAVTLPQNTSQFVPPLRSNLAKETSQISVSMSSLIDFDNNLLSQGDDMQPIEEADLIKDQRPKTEEDTRKKMLFEKAESLRTRLQLAIFKINTNQISRPFARLQVPRARSSSPELPVLSSSPLKSSSTPRGGSVQRATTILEPKVARARARATMDPKSRIAPLSSLPVPKIAPTTFSARRNDDLDANQESQSSQVEPAYIPSSPPEPQAPTAAFYMDTTGNRREAEPRTPIQPSSLIGGDHGDDDSQKVGSQQSRIRHGGLTSSVVKGEAASSLLELVRGGGATSGEVGMCGL